MFRWSLLLLLVVPAVSAAVPLTLTHQGRLFDSTSTPLEGPQDLTFALYDASSGGSELWSTTRSLDLASGYYSVRLGEVDALDASVFAGDAVFLEITPSGGTPLDRLPIDSVAFALRAQDATNVVGGRVEASEVVVGGSTVISGDGTLTGSALVIGGTTVVDSSGALSADVSWSSITDTPPVLDDGAVDWSEVTNPPPVLDDGDVDWTELTGLPSTFQHGDVQWTELVGVPGDLADGDADTLGALSCSEGQVAAMISSSWSCVTLDAAAVGALSTTGDITTGGGVQLADTSADCDDSSRGMLRYDEALFLCGEDGWREVGKAPLGSSRSVAASSCKEIQDSGDGKGDGVYWLEPQGMSPIELYCDMTTDGGGWTLVRVSNGTTSPNLKVASAVQPSALIAPDANTNAQLADTAVDAMGSVLMAVNTGTSLDSHIWYDKNRASNEQNRHIKWTYDGSLPRLGTEYQASSVYPPSDSRWGQDVGGTGTHVNWLSDHPLCFGSWSTSTKGHMCINRNSTDWWNYGKDGATSSNGNAKTALYVR